MYQGVLLQPTSDGCWCWCWAVLLVLQVLLLVYWLRLLLLLEKSSINGIDVARLQALPTWYYYYLVLVLSGAGADCWWMGQ